MKTEVSALYGRPLATRTDSPRDDHLGGSSQVGRSYLALATELLQRMTLESFEGVGGWGVTSAGEHARVCPKSEKPVFWHTPFLGDVKFV